MVSELENGKCCSLGNVHCSPKILVFIAVLVPRLLHEHFLFEVWTWAEVEFGGMCCFCCIIACIIACICFILFISEFSAPVLFSSILFGQLHLLFHLRAKGVSVGKRSGWSTWLVTEARNYMLVTEGPHLMASWCLSLGNGLNDCISWLVKHLAS